MKMTVTLLCALALGVGVTHAAQEQNKKDVQTPDPKVGCDKSQTCQADKGIFRPQTGSRIQRGVNLSGRITDGPYQLIIINEKMIRQSGATTVAQVLNRSGVRR